MEALTEELEGLKGSSGGGARELAGFSKGSGRGRLSWSILTGGDFVLVDKGDSGLDRTNRDTRDLELQRADTMYRKQREYGQGSNSFPLTL